MDELTEDPRQLDLADERESGGETNALIAIGRVLRSSTAEFAVGCRVLSPMVPAFGSFVKVQVQVDTEVYGIIYNVVIEDDRLIRELVGAPDITAEYIRDQRENRQVPIEVSVLVVGYKRGEQLYQHLPPQPPLTLNDIHQCSSEEVVAFTAQFDYFRTVLNMKEMSTSPDEVLAASLRAAARSRGDVNEGRKFLVQAGRELSRLLSNDLVRLNGLLGQIRV